MGDSFDGKDIALLIPLFAICTQKSVNDPEKASVIGGWISVFGETLSAIADTDLFFQQREEEKNKIMKEIEELQKKLDTLNK